MSWYHRFANVFRPLRTSREIDREIRFHIREREEDLRASGFSRDEAARSARLRFGNPTVQRERTHDMDIARWLDSALRNLRLAARSLAKTPGFTATVVLTLALGIGANSAVFSAIDAILLRPLPFPDADRLMRLNQRNSKDGETFVAPLRLADWNRRTATFETLTGYYAEDTSELSGELPEKLKRASVAPYFLQVLRIAPALGRDFNAAETRTSGFGGPNAVIISDRYWRRKFNAEPAAIGKQLRVGQNSYTVVGVMPPTFQVPDRDVDLWLPVPTAAPYTQNRNATWYTVIGRLKPGVSVAQARSDLTALQAGLGREYGGIDAEIRVEIEPWKEITVAGVRQSLWVVFGSVSLLLLIACTNIAALLLSRSAQRQQEIAVRFSLGASRSSVAAQLLTETFLLALSGAALGVLVAASASGVFRALAGNLPRVDEIGLDWRLMFYTLATAIAVTVLCGLIPALRGTRREMREALAQSGRTQVSARRPLQWTLVGVQVALAVTLLAGAGLLLRSFQALGNISPGFDPSHVLTMHISISWAEVTRDFREKTKRMLDTLASVPGVEGAASTLSLPGVPFNYQVQMTVVEGRPATEPPIMADAHFVSPGYFAMLRIPLIAGEMCLDRPAGSYQTAVVNRSFANLYLAGTKAIGMHLRPSNGFSVLEIRGIVEDARENGIDRVPTPATYTCGIPGQPNAFFLVRTRGEPTEMAQTIRRKIHEIEPNRSVFDITPLEQHLSDSFAQNRLRTILLAFFAVTAVSLACVGLYGTLSYLVSIRRREVGLRLALGAARGTIVKQFLAQGIGVTFAACIAGLALSFAFTRLLAGMLYGVSPNDPPTLSMVILTVLLVAAAASLAPSIRAARVQPMQVLRDE